MKSLASSIASIASIAGVTVAAVGALAACAPTPGALPGIRAPYCFSAPVVKPTRIVIACGDGNLQATHIVYQLYRTSSAAATATMEANDCLPNCAEGHFHAYPAKLAFSNVQAGRFTRVVVTYTGGIPFGSSVQTYPLG
jgi:hypothetical protein